MRNEDKVKKLVAALTLASSFALAISIFFASKINNNNDGRRRRKSVGKPSSSLCYLKVDESKPQSVFKLVLADNSYSPFKHLSLHPITSVESRDLHPYIEEISGLLKEPKVEEALEEYNEKLEEVIRRNSCVWVDKGLQLQELAEVLSKERLFAVDVEHNSFRSFLGFAALIQISTKKEDYLVDAIALHDLMGILRPVFSNPQICKACHVLSKPQTSLAYLLKTYCGVVTNKELRREDWRQRPLPQEMVRYAKKDSHYLLYIARCLYEELKLQDLGNSSCVNDKLTYVLEVTGRSNATCLPLFSKVVEPYPGHSAASSIISRFHKGQGNYPSTNKKYNV
ncbi:hypothetical protein DM860_009013 [Cuscuta australis]|uniref:3'-5' exonuclease domain-containing protein n=1 Tax=Cuscuta australis TaxID=267555 RepID=A0A328DC14_9ASTE|nr:hypothetical protein DM860_009013 [Cuscuta australis]